MDKTQNKKVAISSILIPWPYILTGILFNFISMFLKRQEIKGIGVNLFLLGLLVTVLLFFAYTRRSYYWLYIALLGMGIQSEIFRYIITTCFAVLMGIYALRRNAFFTRDGKRIAWFFFLLTAYLFMLYIFFQGIFSDVWTFPLYTVTFLSYPASMVFMQYMSLSERQLDWMGKSIISFLFVQMATVLLAPLFFMPVKNYLSGLFTIKSLLNSFGIHTFEINWYSVDIHSGVLSSATNTGNIALFLLIFVCMLYLTGKRKIYLVCAVVLFYLFLMTGSRHMFLGFFIAAFTIFFFIQLKQKKISRKLIYAGLLLLISFIILVNFNTINAKLDIFSYRFFYTKYNPKQVLFQRCLDYITENPLVFLSGHGPGTFGSRVSNARAGDILEKIEIKMPSFIPYFSNEAYSNLMNDLYVFHFIDKEKKSGALMNPFASIVGIVMEMGILGSLIFFWILFIIIKNGIWIYKKDISDFWRSFGIMTSFSVILMLINSIFKQYFEHPAVMMPFWIMIGVLLLRKKFLEKRQ